MHLGLLLWVGLVGVCGVRGRFSSALCRGITASVCCLPSPPRLPPGGEQHCPPAAASARIATSLQFRRLEYLDCATLNSSFQEEELDGLAHLGSGDSPWSNHVELTWCDFGHQDPLLDEWWFSERMLGVSWANTPKSVSSASGSLSCIHHPGSPVN